MLEPLIITRVASWGPDHSKWLFLSGVPDLWDRNKILRGGDLSHLHVPDCIWIFFYFVWFVFIYHNLQFYFELCTYCNILDIHLLWNLNYVNYLQVYMRLLIFLFCNMLGSVLECYELTGVSLLWPWLIKGKQGLCGKIWALLRSIRWLYSNCKFQVFFWSIRYKRYRLLMIYCGLFFNFVLFA